jgi:hypothetical protein
MSEPLICGRCGGEVTGTTCETCADRRVNASIAANARWAREPSRARATAPARAAGPASVDYWIGKVDPDRQMSNVDRVKAAENARREFYQRLGKTGRKAKKAKRPTP